MSAAPAALTAEPIEIRFANGETKLAGALLLPSGKGPWPAAVVIHGSGKVDREQPWARQIAQVLLDNGVAVLLPDKRGAGASGGDWQTAGFTELADDALSAVAAIRNVADVDKSRIGLIGLSQGGRIAPAAAANSGDVAFAISLVSGVLSYPEASYHEMANTARQAGFNPAQVKQVLELQGAAGRYVTSGEWARYAEMRHRLLRSDVRVVAEGFPATPDAPIWTFLRKVYAFTPLPYWLGVDQPVLIVQAAGDEKDNVAVAESTRRLNYALELSGKDNFTIVVLPGLGHSLREPGAREVSPTFIKVVREFLQTHVHD